MDIRILQYLSISLRVELFGSQSLENVSRQTKRLHVVSISPLRTKINFVPRTDVHFIDTLP